MNSILLIQRGISASLHPVSGKSGKLYGQAVYSGQHGGAIFKMSIDQYRQASDDIIGNTIAGQQWVPEIVSDEDAAKLPESQPVPTPKRETPDVQSRVEDPTQRELAPQRFPAPVIGTDREHGTPPAANGPTEPAPGIVTPPPIAKIEKDRLSSPVSSKPALPSAVQIIVDAVSERIIADFGPKLEQIAHMRNGHKSARKRRNETEFTSLQKQARVLGINSFGKDTETLRGEVLEATKGG